MTAIRKGSPEWASVTAAFGSTADLFDYAEQGDDGIVLGLDGPGMAVAFGEGDFVVTGEPVPGEYARAWLGRSS